MPYDQFTLHDFILDDFFIAWVKSPEPQSTIFWEDWLMKHPEKRALVEEARQLVLTLSDPGKELGERDKKQLWENINKKIQAQTSAKVSKQEVAAPRHSLFKWFFTGRVAASIIAILMLAAWIGWMSMHNHSSTVQFTTKYSEIKNIALPDGSQITLNANSTLRYSSEWNEQEDREVQLTGEAFFDVRKKPGKGNAKFIVHSQGLDIEVLGTQFNVNNRRDRVEVVLQEGKVGLSQVGNKGSSVTMAPGDYIAYSNQDSRILRKKVNPLLYSSWKEEETVFEEKPLYEIAEVLEDTKGVKMVFLNDSLKTLSFTGTLPNNDIDAFLMVLSKSFRINVSKEGNQIMLQKNK
ncbi:FecR domain-containing protein [Rhodocytophaga aerolata]|uniref:FecR domain-containing protein n=1 Tax=Rhodocytophaga aerolata TaxID=455078 RepID=A0ABT8RGL5_9BACT|nr:FecR domain-containing protein [Rhodocytophaga aerolata]MDO1451248.1 FecR domain-containing protein [Rhodocytophaga aerolata]